MTHIQTFQCIVLLATRYPSLRRIFLHAHSGMAEKSSLSCLPSELLKKPENERVFFRNFAVAIISEHKPSAIHEQRMVHNVDKIIKLVEQSPPDHLTIAHKLRGFSVIESLLGFCRSVSHHSESVNILTTL